MKKLKRKRGKGKMEVRVDLKDVETLGSNLKRLETVLDQPKKALTGISINQIRYG